MNGPEDQVQNPAAAPPVATPANTTVQAQQQQPAPEQYAPQSVPPAVGGQDPRSKSPGLAGFLSVIPGLGQIYVGYYRRGFVHAGVIVLLITTLANLRNEGLVPLFALPMAFIWLYNIIDAIRRASLYNQYLIGKQEIDLPEDFNMPSLGGSIVGGLLLIAGGTALLLNTRFDISFDWVEDWWPVAPILIGVYLLVKAIQERSAGKG